jgi:spore coat polysaccharide biosynthesis protein SpsF (cytidylyltransferase family)
MKAGIVICSRLSSSRIPQKAIHPLNGIPLINHLVGRLIAADLPIILAVPEFEAARYVEVLGDLSRYVHFYTGAELDPLNRMAEAADAHSLDVVVRITHDKIFVDPAELLHVLSIYRESSLDYLYSSSFVPGTGFEVIRTEKLKEAAEKFKNVEHISYAIHAVTERKTDLDMGHRNTPHRLLVDYPEDIWVIEKVLQHLGNDCLLGDVLAHLNKNPDISSVNRLPILSIYTCAFNAKDWIARAMESVSWQKNFWSYEYILIDDCSTDSTPEIIGRFADRLPNVHWKRNDHNLGLASSSNVALGMARGKYILRLDADDYLCKEDVLWDMVQAMENSSFDALYPDHYLGTLTKIEKGNVNHHVGGAIFRTRAMNHMKFTDGLRGFEGLDLFARAKTQLRIGYYDKPTFFYRQHDASLSKQNPELRQIIKEEIERKHGA